MNRICTALTLLVATSSAFGAINFEMDLEDLVFEGFGFAIGEDVDRVVFSFEALEPEFGLYTNGNSLTNGAASWDEDRWVFDSPGGSEGWQPGGTVPRIAIGFQALTSDGTVLTGGQGFILNDGWCLATVEQTSIQTGPSEFRDWITEKYQTEIQGGTTFIEGSTGIVYAGLRNEVSYFKDQEGPVPSMWELDSTGELAMTPDSLIRSGTTFFFNGGLYDGGPFTLEGRAISWQEGAFLPTPAVTTMLLSLGVLSRRRRGR